MPRKVCGSALLLSVGAMSAALFTLTGAQEPPSPSGNPPDAPKTATAEQRDLTLRTNLPGRVDSQARRRVVLDLESFGGSVEVTEVLRRSGPVKEGDQILAVDTEAIDDAIEDAEVALKQARQNFEFSQEEQKILGEANQIRIERANDAAENAEHAFEIFDRFTGERMVRSAELRVLQSQYGLADQREELAQLEKMYEESTLASETKEIVLERNRRQIAISEQYLQFAQDDLLITREYTFPDQKEAVEDALRFANIELQHALIQTKMAEARKVNEVQNAARALEDAEKRLGDLHTDRERIALTAPAAGLLTPISLVTGDQVRAGQVIAEVVDPAALVITFTAQPGDLRILSEGDSVDVRLPAYPEVRLSGEVTEIAAVGVPSGESTGFPVRVALKGQHPLVRIGLNCTVAAAETLQDVLTVPAAAVHVENGTSVCYVTRAGGEPEKREVIVGASNAEFVQIVEGLKEGDSVLLEKPAATEDQQP